MGLVADRGVAAVALRRLGDRWGGGYRRRIKRHCLVQRRGQGRAYGRQSLPKRQGKAVVLQYVALTGERYGPVQVALAPPRARQTPG